MIQWCLDIFFDTGKIKINSVGNVFNFQVIKTFNIIKVQ